MRPQVVSAHPEYENCIVELKQFESNEYIQLVFTTDETDMGAAKLAFRANVDGFVWNYCRDVWHRFL